MLDIDFFKQVNDTYGHPVGDIALKLMSAKCLSTLRTTDIFGRIGGEEFAAVLVETNRERALEVAERLRQNVESLTFDADGHTVSFTVSIGLTEFSENDSSLEKVTTRADNALYKAKSNGRNQVAII